MSRKLRIYRSTLDDAKRSADAAFKRLGDRLAACGFPRVAPKGKFAEWAETARTVAPTELADVIIACKSVKRLMEGK